MTLHEADNKVFGWYANFDGCAYYRVTKPLSALQETFLTPDSWLTEADRFLPPDWRDYDVVVGQRIANGTGDGNGPADKWVEEITRSNHVLSVYEVDDDLFSVDESNPAFEFFSRASVRDNMRLCMNKADLVTVSTEPLREVALRYNPNVVVLPNFVDHDVIHIPRKESREDKVVIGWCGSPTHDGDFAPVSEEIGLAMAMLPQTRFTSIGAKYLHGLPIDRSRHIPWIDTTRKVYQFTAGFDIGIAPLADTKFNESKSYLKALEYAALGIPCIASNRTPYREFIEHEETGFLVEKPGEWKEYITLLTRDAELRETMGAAARKKAERYTIQNNIDLWANAYRA